jgi:phosphoglycolate phosphatase-like HAD superfamily hydrolase
MIIFDLDGTLADCEHRRHFLYDEKTLFRRKPDWDAFFEACDQDSPIKQVIQMWNDQISLGGMGSHEIWSGRSSSVRKKTEDWLSNNLLCFDPNQLKMRPVGDSTPDDILKEQWLNEALTAGKTIDYVFDDRPKVIRMWRKRGIFAFNCCQREGNF